MTHDLHSFSNEADDRLERLRLKTVERSEALATRAWLLQPGAELGQQRYSVCRSGGVRGSRTVNGS